MYVKEKAALEGHISGFLRYDADKEGIMGKAGILAGIAVLVLSACSWSIATEGADVVFRNPTDDSVSISIDGIDSIYSIPAESEKSIHLPPFRGEYAQGSLTVYPEGTWFTGSSQVFSFRDGSTLELKPDIAWIILSAEDGDSASFSISYGLEGLMQYQIKPLAARSKESAVLDVIRSGNKAYLRVPFSGSYYYGKERLDVDLAYMREGMSMEQHITVSPGKEYLITL